MEITTGSLIRWIAGLTVLTLLAFLGFALLRFVGDGEAERPEAVSVETEPGTRETTDLSEVEERLAAKNAIAEDTPTGQMVLAARNGDVSLLRYFLDEGIGPDAEESENGHRALHGAAAAGEVEAVELLLDAGADVNALDGAGVTALMRAALSAAVPAGKRLVDAGAEVNALSESGETALTQTVVGSFKRHHFGGAERRASEMEFAEMLFERGADPGIYPKDSPLKILVVSQNLEMLTLFIENGAQVDDDPDLLMLSNLPGPIGEALRMR